MTVKTETLLRKRGFEMKRAKTKRRWAIPFIS